LQFCPTETTEHQYDSVTAHLCRLAIFGRVITKVFEPGFDFTIKLNEQGVTLAIHRLSGLNLHPILGNTIFFNAMFPLAAKIDANPAG